MCPYVYTRCFYHTRQWLEGVISPAASPPSRLPVLKDGLDSTPDSAPLATRWTFSVPYGGVCPPGVSYGVCDSCLGSLICSRPASFYAYGNGSAGCHHKLALENEMLYSALTLRFSHPLLVSRRPRKGVTEFLFPALSS